MEKWRAFRNSPRYEDAKGGVVKKGKNLLMTILQIILIVGISYVILSPVIRHRRSVLLFRRGLGEPDGLHHPD